MYSNHLRCKYTAFERFFRPFSSIIQNIDYSGVLINFSFSTHAVCKCEHFLSMAISIKVPFKLLCRKLTEQRSVASKPSKPFFLFVIFLAKKNEMESISVIHFNAPNGKVVYVLLLLCKHVCFDASIKKSQQSAL